MARPEGARFHAGDMGEGRARCNAMARPVIRDDRLGPQHGAIHRIVAQGLWIAIELSCIAVIGTCARPRRHSTARRRDDQAAERIEVMKIAHLLASLGTVALAAAPVVGQAAETPTARIASPVSDSEELAGGSSLIIFLAFSAAVVAALVIVSDDEEDEPESP